MTNAWFLGAQNGVPQSEDSARSTVDPVRTDGELAEAAHEPEWNDPTRDSDESGELTGLAPRTVGSHTIDSEQYVPPNIGLINFNHNALIDDQVATSGTAAARESQGIQGHGTMQIEKGIEPLNPANRFGNDYFVRGKLSANEGSGDYMTPPDQDNWQSAVAQSVATKNARQAQQSTLFQNFAEGSW